MTFDADAAEAFLRRRWEAAEPTCVTCVVLDADPAEPCAADPPLARRLIALLEETAVPGKVKATKRSAKAKVADHKAKAKQEQELADGASASSDLPANVELVYLPIDAGRLLVLLPRSGLEQGRLQRYAAHLVAYWARRADAAERLAHELDALLRTHRGVVPPRELVAQLRPRLPARLEQHQSKPIWELIEVRRYFLASVGPLSAADAVYPNAVAIVPSADGGAQLLDYDQLQAMMLSKT